MVLSWKRYSPTHGWKDGEQVMVICWCEGCFFFPLDTVHAWAHGLVRSIWVECQSLHALLAEWFQISPPGPWSNSAAWSGGIRSHSLWVSWRRGYNCSSVSCYRCSGTMQYSAVRRKKHQVSMSLELLIWPCTRCLSDKMRLYCN